MKNDDAKSQSDKASMLSSLSTGAQALQLVKEAQLANSSQALKGVSVPKTLDDNVKLETSKTKGHSNTSSKRTVAHSNFDSKRKPLDPARPLTDIPEPAIRNKKQITSIFQKKLKQASSFSFNSEQLSKWQLVQSPELEEHLSLLQAGQLAKLPKSFYKNSSKQPLLSSLLTMQMLDLADISNALTAYPNITRYGIKPENKNMPPAIVPSDELPTLDRASDWEAILYPERFDDGSGVITTDIIAVSIAVHALKHCPKRQGINDKLSAYDIVHYIRSYVLSQCTHIPKLSQKLRHTPIFTGHIIVAAHYLGFKINIENTGAVYFNVGSRCGLFSRYPILADYYINGWQ